MRRLLIQRRNQIPPTPLGRSIVWPLLWLHGQSAARMPTTMVLLVIEIYCTLFNNLLVHARMWCTPGKAQLHTPLLVSDHSKLVFARGKIVCRGNIFANYHHLVCEHTPFILHAAFELMK